jgi:hypothetical protein
VAVVAFIAVAATIRVVWDSQYRYLTTGDEPHYLIAGRSLSHFRTVDMTKAYQEEFTRAYFYPPRFPASPGSLPTRSTTAHVFPGSHGYAFSHGLGIPAIIALPSEWFGTTGARMALVVLASVLVLIAWFAGGLFFTDRRARLVATLVVSIALPYLTAANQISPDLPAGVFCGTATLACAYLALLGGTARTMRVTWLGALALVPLPWLHVRFAATGALLACALVVFAARTRRLKPTASLTLAIPFVLSTLLVLVYNQYVFGDAFSVNGGNGTLQVNGTSLVVLVGLHIDRLQGLFVQNPILLLGVVGIFLLWQQFRLLAATIATVYASLVVLPAMENITYGGQTLAGRFALAGSVVLLVPAMTALNRLREKSRLFFIAVCSATTLLESWYVFRVLFDDMDTYNHTPGTPLHAYPSWLPGFPALYDSSWAYHFAANYVGIVIMLATIGLLAVWLRLPREQRSSRLLDAARTDNRSS